MKIIVLGSGTSQGVPVIACNCTVCRSLDFRDQRLRVSVYLEVDDLCLVIDTGPDFRTQMLREKITQIDAVLYTHAHKDHTAGMDDLRTFNFKQNRDIPIYARQEVINQLKQEFAYIFVDKAEKYPGVLNVEPHIIENQAFKIKQTTILPIQVFHHKLPVFGFRIQDFAYITDVNFIPEPEFDKLTGLKYLILGALQHKPHLSHFTIAQAVEVAQRVQAGRTFLTHLSHTVGLHAELEKTLPPNIHLAYDGLTLWA